MAVKRPGRPKKKKLKIRSFSISPLGLVGIKLWIRLVPTGGPKPAANERCS